MTRTSLFAAAAFALGVSSTAMGAGFQINEHGASAMARSGSVVATIDDPSSVLYNPAGLTATKGTELSLGVTVIRPTATMDSSGLPSTNSEHPATKSQSIDASPAPLPNFYATHALSDRAFIGVGFYMPYGLALKWEDPDHFVGRTVARELELRTFFITPTIALKLSDAVSVGLGVSLVPADVYLSRTLGASDTGQVLFPGTAGGKEGSLELAASAFGVGATAGIQIALVEHLRIGVAFRSTVELAFSGKANFDLPEGTPTEVAANFPDQNASAEMTLPHVINVGIGWVQGGLTLEASSQITVWSANTETRIHFEQGKPFDSAASPRDWETTPMFRLGGQYAFGDASIGAGVVYDFTPIPDDTMDPTLPDASRWAFSLGGGYSFGRVRADLSFMAVPFPDKKITGSENVNFKTDATYQAHTIWLGALSIGVKI